MILDTSKLFANSSLCNINQIGELLLAEYGWIFLP